ncbi:MAG: NAD(P)-dependent oxidoreductase [Bacteroidales bacterium]|nr:NAD(P)-dependent oxidoreductase [Bacteroidales bacterium]
MTKKNIVVFGATGAVGVYTVMHLLNSGYNVFAVGKRNNDNGFFSEHFVRYYSVDITKYENFSILPIDNIYAIVHLAGFLPANMNGNFNHVYIDINIIGTLNILQYAVAVGVQRVVYSTSFSDVSYLWGTKDPIGPESPIKFPIDNDHSIYSISKNTGVNILQHYSHKYNFKYFILRFPNIYLFHPNPTYFVNGIKRWKGACLIISQAKKGEDIELWGNPMIVRDMVYVKDCTQIIEKSLSANSEGGIFNVGTGIGTTREDQIKGIIKVFSSKSYKSKIIYRTDLPDSPQYIMDISKTQKELGFELKYNYIKYLLDYKKEMEENRFKKLWGVESDYI